MSVAVQQNAPAVLRRAVDDTLAAAASMAGGMNSYAVTAAQQAGDYYNAKLMDVLPELEELARQLSGMGVSAEWVM